MGKFKREIAAEVEIILTQIHVLIERLASREITIHNQDVVIHAQREALRSIPDGEIELQNQLE